MDAPIRRGRETKDQSTRHKPDEPANQAGASCANTFVGYMAEKYA
jgi:hypothetical protein